MSDPPTFSSKNKELSSTDLLRLLSFFGRVHKDLLEGGGLMRNDLLSKKKIENPYLLH